MSNTLFGYTVLAELDFSDYEADSIYYVSLLTDGVGVFALESTGCDCCGAAWDESDAADVYRLASVAAAAELLYAGLAGSGREADGGLEVEAAVRAAAAVLAPAAPAAITA